MSTTPCGGAAIPSSPSLLQSSVPLGLSQVSVTRCCPTSVVLPLRCTTSVARGCTAGSVATCSASNTPRMLSFPSCERFAASANKEKETCIVQHRQGERCSSTFHHMSTTAGQTAGDTSTPGHASAGPGVWLTDLSLVL